jgi:phosphatidate phosphatase PAH1
MNDDVICVITSFSIICSDFHIRFKHKSYTDSYNLEENKSITEILSNFDRINFSSNSFACEGIFAFIDNNGIVNFYDTITNQTLTTPNSNILMEFLLKYKRNTVIAKNARTLETLTFNFWLYNFYDKFVVMDIDGTITKSDIRGYLATVFLQNFTYIHDGIIEFLNNLVEKFDLNILYVTARPISHRNITLQFLEGIKDNKNINIPAGPLFTNSELILNSLYSEVITKSTMTLKSNILISIAQLFKNAGCKTLSPFLLGFFIYCVLLICFY